MNELAQLNSILPINQPMDQEMSQEYFYRNVLKLLVKPSIVMCENGITLDMPKVYALDGRLDQLLQSVAERLAANEYIQEFQALQYKLAKSAYIESQRGKQRSIDYYLKPFKPKDMTHRSYLMNYLFITQPLPWKPEALLPNGVTKWAVKDVKHLLTLTDCPIADELLANLINSESTIIRAAMRMLAVDQSNLYNQKYLDAIANPPADLLPPFNPGSNKQKKLFFDHLHIPPLAFSKDTGEPSWGREQLVELSKSTDDSILQEALQAMIEFSQGAIVKNNFVKGFIDYSVNGNLRSNIKLFGTKTMRPTSGRTGYVNFLNLPSTGSIFAEPIKQCIIARPGFVQLSSDYASLEDKIIANLSGDKNKIITQTDSELDAHLFHATIYFRDKFTAILGDLPHRELTIAAKAAMDAGNKQIKSLRQSSKGVTFGASYGAFPQKIADSIGCSLAEGEQIFNAYHNDMYPGITAWRDEVLAKAKSQGYIEMGLGAKITIDDLNRDARTVFNSQSQFWSILTLLALAKLHYRIVEANLQDDVLIVNTIYDAIYLEVRDNPATIKWANETLIDCMQVDFIHGQIIPNDAECELSLNLAKVITLSKQATIFDIESTLAKLKE